LEGESSETSSACGLTVGAPPTDALALNLDDEDRKAAAATSVSDRIIRNLVPDSAPTRTPGGTAAPS